MYTEKISEIGFQKLENEPFQKNSPQKHEKTHIVDFPLNASSKCKTPGRWKIRPVKTNIFVVYSKPK